MLSVLIPTYNYNSFPLVEEIHNQLKKTAIDFEIICLDDASQSELNAENQKINELEFCHFSELKINLGRSAIRNLLVSKSKFNWLLFLDGDVLPVNTTFIDSYLQCIKENSFYVFTGGVKYKSDKLNETLLHYKVGFLNEEVDFKKRQKKPYKYFFSSNFLIEKSVFEGIKFEERLKEYGKEDLLFSLKLKENEINIHHIENQVYHLGVDEDRDFLIKTKQAMKNLAMLKDSKIVSKKESSLLQLASFLKSFGLTNILERLVPSLEKKIGKKNSLFYFKLLKISYLCSFLK